MMGGVTRTKRLPLFFLIVFFTAGAILLACTSYCFAADIQPPTDEQADEAAQSCVLLKNDEGWEIYKYVKMHKVTDQSDVGGYVINAGGIQVDYYLYVIVTTTLTDPDTEIDYAHAAFDAFVFVGVEGRPTTLESDLGCPYRASESMEEALSALDSYMHEDFETRGLEPGWPVVSSTGAIISPGSDGEQAPGGGSKIPGPGSWWQWLTGTVVAGTIASLLSLLNLLFGTAPPPPLVPAAPVRKPAPPPPDAPRIGPAGEYHSEPPGLMEDTRRGMRDAVEIGSLFFQNVINDIKDTAKWVYNGVTDPDKVRDTFHQLEDSNRQRYDSQKKYLADALNDPKKPFKDMSDWMESAAKYLKNDPLGVLKSLLSFEYWEKAMDWRRPLLERFGYSAIATLNTIGLIEGASGLKNWLFGGGGAKGAVGVVDDVLTKTPGPKRRLLINTAGKVDDVSLAKVPKVMATGQKSPFHSLSQPQKGELKGLWKSQLEKGDSRIKAFRKAMKSGDMQAQAEAVVGIQGDTLAKTSLNAKDKSMIKSFNKRLKKIQNEALGETKQHFANGKGISKVEDFKATNPRAPGAKAKVRMDDDITLRTTDEGGTIRDVPAKDLQPVYDKKYHDSVSKAMGRTPAETPGQLGQQHGNVGVDKHSAEAYDDFDKVMKGQAPSDPAAVGKTITFKGDQQLALGDELFKSGDLKGAMDARFKGMRETGKQFNNQVMGRVEVIRGQVKPGSEAWKRVNAKIADVEDTIGEMNKMIAARVDPLKIDKFLASRKTTVEALSKRTGEIYEELTRWAK